MFFSAVLVAIDGTELGGIRYGFQSGSDGACFSASSREGESLQLALCDRKKVFVCQKKICA